MAGGSVRQEFVDILSDSHNEETDDELIELIEEVDEEELVAVDFVDVQFVEEEDIYPGSLWNNVTVLEMFNDGLIQPVVINQQSDERMHSASPSDDDGDDNHINDEDNDMDHDRQRSALSIPQEVASNVETPRFVIPPAARRGRGSGRRGGSGARVAGLHTRSSNVWVRGQPFVEIFVSDEDLPAKMRQAIDHQQQELNQRLRREQIEQRRSAAFVEQMDDQHEYEQFFDAREFKWRPVHEWEGVKEKFVPTSTGPTTLVKDSYEAFRMFWDDEILSHIVVETNRRAQAIAALSKSFCKTWYDTTTDELLILFSFWMMLGIVRMPTIKSCYSTIPLLRTSIFRYLLPQSRYWDLNRAFHLANTTPDANDRNPISSMGPVLSHLNSKFQQCYRLQQDICIDESLTLWKGSEYFKQYIKTKSARFGIKSYQLCESSTGYLWSFFIYVGKLTTTSTMPVSFTYVRKLVQPLLNLGHTLYLDNWFNSPALARFLKQNKTDCVGTLRSNRKGVPRVIKMAPLKEGEFIARQSGDVLVVGIHDRRRISLISTCHGLAQIKKPPKPGRPAHYRLQLVEDYSHGMGGVDQLDQMLETYLVERKKCHQWTNKMFKRLLNVSIQNARILLEQTEKKKAGALAFRIDLVQHIVDKHLHRLQKPVARTTLRFSLERLTGRHFIRRTPVTESMRKAVKNPENRGKRRCVWCSANKAKTRTVYECPVCQVPLCLDFCFEAYHTQSRVPNSSNM